MAAPRWLLSTCRWAVNTGWLPYWLHARWFACTHGRELEALCEAPSPVLPVLIGHLIWTRSLPRWWAAQ